MRSSAYTLKPLSVRETSPSRYRAQSPYISRKIEARCDLTPRTPERKNMSPSPYFQQISCFVLLVREIIFCFEDVASSVNIAYPFTNRSVCERGFIILPSCFEKIKSCVSDIFLRSNKRTVSPKEEERKNSKILLYLLTPRRRTHRSHSGHVRQRHHRAFVLEWW